MAIYYRGYQRLMAHWRRIPPNAMIEISYEDTVPELAAQARRLVAFAGLP